MKRFFGMMPSSEVTLERTYKDNEGLRIRLQAGPHGWTVIYADRGTEYKAFWKRTECYVITVA